MICISSHRKLGTQELSPRFPAGKAVGAEVPATPTPVIGAVLVGTELLLRVDGTLTSSRVGQEKRWGTRGLGMGMDCLLIGITQRFMEEARKGLRGFGALAWWWNGLGEARASGGSLARPQDMEQEAQLQQGDQQKLRENQVGEHDVAPSHRGEIWQFYLIFGFQNYPFAGGTRPAALACELLPYLNELHSRP